MSHLDPTRRTSPGDLRKFGLMVGAVFLFIASYTYWRHRPIRLSVTFATLGSLLFVFGLIAPAALRGVYTGWMRLAMVLNRVTTPILMGVIYFVVLTPTAFLRRAFGWKPFAATDVSTMWVTRAPGKRASSLERQF